MSQSSMGADVADINNDGLPDILVMDMKAEDPIRYKELMNLMQYDRYNLMVQYGYGRQDGRNVLQLNNGTVSYTHLRAHETVLDLVCRLLLEKKTHHINHIIHSLY